MSAERTVLVVDDEVLIRESLVEILGADGFRALSADGASTAEAVLRAGRILLYDTLSEAWQAAVAGEPFSLRQRADILLAMTHASQSATQAVELACSVAGTSGLRVTSPLQRYSRDVRMLQHHTFVAEPRYETVGQVYLGLPPDFPVLAF